MSPRPEVPPLGGKNWPWADLGLGTRVSRKVRKVSAARIGGGAADSREAAQPVRAWWKDDALLAGGPAMTSVEIGSEPLLISL
jgi:hypothetical protein